MIMLQRLVKIKWYELLVLGVFYTTILTLGIIFRTDVLMTSLVISNSILGITTLYLISKGYIFGNVIGVVQVILLCVISLDRHYYGELISELLFTLPGFAISIYSWTATSRHRERKFVHISSDISKTEWILLPIIYVVAFTGSYFLLRAINTNLLIISTLSFVLKLFYAYFLVKKNKLNFVVKILINIINITMYIIACTQGALNMLPIVVSYFGYLLISTFGLVNWIMIERRQSANKLYYE